MKKTLLTIREVADEIKHSTDFIRDEMAKKHLAYYKLAGRYYVSQEDLADYLARSRVAAFGERAERARRIKGGAK